MGKKRVITPPINNNEKKVKGKESMQTSTPPVTPGLFTGTACVNTPMNMMNSPMNSMYQYAMPVPPYMGMSQVSPSPQTTHTTDQSSELMRFITQRFDAVDKKLSQLDSIKHSISAIDSRLDKLDSRINEIEKSNKFLATNMMAFKQNHQTTQQPSRKCKQNLLLSH